MESPIEIFTLWLDCLRCGHRWVRRDLAKLPKCCPECNSPYWAKPRKKDVIEKSKEVPE